MLDFGVISSKTFDFVTSVSAAVVLFVRLRLELFHEMTFKQNKSREAIKKQSLPCELLQSVFLYNRVPWFLMMMRSKYEFPWSSKFLRIWV